MHKRKRIITIVTAVVLVFALALPTLAASVSVNYSATLSLSSASTTTYFPDYSYSGGASVRGTWYYYNPSNPSETSSGSTSNTTSTGPGRTSITASCNAVKASNQNCTKVYAATSNHYGGMSGPGGSDNFSATRSV